jgi:hypothetical protein
MLNMTHYPVSVTTASKVATELLRRPLFEAGAFLRDGDFA